MSRQKNHKTKHPERDQSKKGNNKPDLTVNIKKSKDAMESSPFTFAPNPNPPSTPGKKKGDLPKKKKKNQHII